MEFWIIVAAAAALIFGYPYIRCFFKRLILAAKLKAVCRRHGFGLYGTHFLWFFGVRRGRSCDFRIETKEEILSVKLFGASRRATILLFTEDGKYFVRSFIAFVGVSSYFRNSIDGIMRKTVPYDFRRGFRDEWEIKSPKNILLVNPVCHEIRWKARNGAEKILGAGEPVNGAEIYSLANLTGYLEAVK